MDASIKNNTTSGGTTSQHSHIKETATELLHEGKKRLNELYDEGCHKVSETQDTVKDYSDDLLKTVKENPLASILIAGGVGFLLSALLKK